MRLKTLLICSVLAVAVSASAAVVAETAAPGAVRTTDGHPDLSGYWSEGGPGGLGALGAAPPPGAKDLSLTPPLRNGDISNLTNDGVIARRSGDNLPLYKPQYWDKVLDLDWNGNKLDPYSSCMPANPPRLGPPRRIIMLPNEVIFFYSPIFQRNDFRDVPIGARNHPVDRDGGWLGDPVAHWEGDDLVVVTEGFNAESWIGPQGYLHGYDMKVTERFHLTPQGLVWQATVEDPEYLQKPWVMDPVRLRLLTGDHLFMEESPPCADRDNKNIVGKQREM